MTEFGVAYRIEYMENIVREAAKGRDWAYEVGNSHIHDSFQKILDDALYFLPDDNRIKQKFKP